MTWTKTSDDYEDDCWPLSDKAYRLHHDGLTWSNRKLLDCRIPKEDLHRFKRPEALPELLERGFWEEDGDYLIIVHHSAYQRTAEQVIKMQDSRRANGAKGGRPKGPSREVWQRKPTRKASSDPSEDQSSGPESYGEPSSEPRGTGQGQDGALEVKGSVPEQREAPEPDSTALPPPCGVDLTTGELSEPGPYKHCLCGDTTGTCTTCFDEPEPSPSTSGAYHPSMEPPGWR